jgi:two-component system, OmpR family, copper resistance phosphate regulon response regulator CusR
VHVLVAEPEPRLAGFIGQGLKEEGHSVEVVLDAEAALDRLAEDPLYDLVVLDVALPTRGGLEVLRVLREHRVEAPVLLLTTPDRTEDIVIGLDLGADATMTKPFVFAELLARVRALLRWQSRYRGSVLRVGDLTLDPAMHHVTRAGHRIALTAREYALLEYFLRNPGQVLTRDMIAEHVWGRGLGLEPESNVVDVYVGYLRSKIDGCGAGPLLHTIRGVGYLLGPAC